MHAISTTKPRAQRGKLKALFFRFAANIQWRPFALSLVSCLVSRGLMWNIFWSLSPNSSTTWAFHRLQVSLPNKLHRIMGTQSPSIQFTWHLCFQQARKAHAWHFLITKNQQGKKTTRKVYDKIVSFLVNVITKSSKKNPQSSSFQLSEKKTPGIPAHHLWCYILAVNLRCHQVAPKKFLKVIVAQGHLKTTTCSHLRRCCFQNLP